MHGLILTASMGRWRRMRSTAGGHGRARAGRWCVDGGHWRAARRAAVHRRCCGMGGSGEWARRGRESADEQARARAAATAARCIDGGGGAKNFGSLPAP
jgi:hypothetical protein